MADLKSAVLLDLSKALLVLLELPALLQLTHVVLHVDSLKYLYFSNVHLSTKDVSLWQIT